MALSHILHAFGEVVGMGYPMRAKALHLSKLGSDTGSCNCMSAFTYLVIHCLNILRLSYTPSHPLSMILGHILLMWCPEHGGLRPKPGTKRQACIFPPFVIAQLSFGTVGGIHYSA